ncbi:uncharacterized protein LOC141899139 [Tubulanus polymorphus]|uniref:uncharacterized protein LOC141899139 n=1 Tax=Tubulanus polymorphus TaxID=672921 RepID=UPI003DA66F20
MNLTTSNQSENKYLVIKPVSNVNRPIVRIVQAPQQMFLRNAPATGFRAPRIISNPMNPVQMIRYEYPPSTASTESLLRQVTPRVNEQLQHLRSFGQYTSSNIRTHLNLSIPIKQTINKSSEVGIEDSFQSDVRLCEQNLEVSSSIISVASLLDKCCIKLIDDLELLPSTHLPNDFWTTENFQSIALPNSLTSDIDVW